MMARRNWSDLEVEATVADYFQMLASELRGEPFNKTDHRRLLRVELQDRSEAAIELKHQNISAVLIELGFPYIDGYKPRGNYQRRLKEVVEERLSQSQALLTLARDTVEAPVPAIPAVEDFLRALEDPPVRGPARDSPTKVKEEVPVYNRGVDYLRREAMNQSLGAAGEAFVLNFERARLIHHGKPGLADRIEQVSQTRGDAVGYDVMSFDSSGRERFIEVKTTRFGKETPFFVSRNQVGVSRTISQQYHLYRVFRFRVSPRLYTLQGALQDICTLEPIEFMAQARSVF
jgi:uncharacterized protein DUF3883